MDLIEIKNRLANIEAMLQSQKNVLTFEEAATYMGVSKSHLYKMTMLGSIAFYKPRGKMIYFNRVELEEWLLQNRITPSDEIEAKANSFLSLNSGRAL